LQQEDPVAEKGSSEVVKPSEPPGGGWQDHDTMRDAAMRPVTGGASTDTLAALGGLDVPGREPASTSALAPQLSHDRESAMIPGARDASTLTHREAGAVSGQFAGADIPAGAPSTMDERTARDHAREGGGAEGERTFGSHR
jgi:hypothetical protein